MLVSPLRDGLNLTAKEFVACSKAGVLLLAPGAGVWHELGEHAVAIDPLSTKEMSSQIMRAIVMPDAERTSRLIQMKRSLQKNTIGFWWQQFTRSLYEEKNVLHLGQSQRSSDQALLLAR